VGGRLSVLAEELDHRALQRVKALADGRVNDLRDDSGVLVAEQVAQALDGLPVDLRCQSELVIWQVFGGLPDHEEVPLDGSEHCLHQLAVAYPVALLKEAAALRALRMQSRMSRSRSAESRLTSSSRRQRLPADVGSGPPASVASASLEPRGLKPRVVDA
jgi:hypothetical protein